MCWSIRYVDEYGRQILGFTDPSDNISFQQIVEYMRFLSDCGCHDFEIGVHGCV